MLVIYRDSSGSVHTIDADNPIVDPLPFPEKEAAAAALVGATKLRPEVRWRVVGRGPFGVHQVGAIGLNGKWPQGVPPKPMVQNINDRPAYAWCPACGQELDLENEIGSINGQWKKVDDRFAEHMKAHTPQTANLPWP